MAEKTRQLLFLFAALLFALLAVFYYFYLAPLQEKKNRQTLELAQLRASVQGIMDKKQEEKKEQVVTEEALAKVIEAIPVTPYTDQLVKDLGRLQTISRVEILSASFDEQKAMSAKDMAEQIIPKEDQQNKASAEAPQERSNASTNSAEQTVAVQTSAEATATHSAKDQKENAGNEALSIEKLKRFLPETILGSVAITISVKGEYEQLYQFLTEVQEMSRYLRVDEISVADTEKDEFVVPSDEKMTATVKLTSYYAPEFKQLIDKLPAVDVEAPSGKDNPFRYGAKNSNGENPKQEEASN
ncbi:type 4a pilus biogenesis protein PilO [Brevibacillus ruminantium]|uniref:Type 4a pilus biogenesis protein PilO n=1 Tax=Brevibacillus ruminantium TaxID=2950604 RepID=A0ABY4WBW2_9BACL|nr:type 4a pilus biogenesis protein PilO [Brevibacillus ruminantium]USG64665.1 type 4a pilus biogenesis protein PilO [Brevibacillus ruminantium]